MRRLRPNQPINFTHGAYDDEETNYYQEGRVDEAAGPVRARNPYHRPRGDHDKTSNGVDEAIYEAVPLNGQHIFCQVYYCHHIGL
jgi:hypothetical protein